MRRLTMGAAEHVLRRVAGFNRGGAVARNASYRLAATGVDIARAAITMPLIARELGVADYGLWSVAMTILAMLQPIAVTGITGTMVRECARFPEREASIVDAGQRIRSLCALVCIPLAAALGLAIAGPRAALISAGLGLVLWIDARASATVLLTVRLRDDRRALCRLVASLTFLTGVVAAVALDGGLAWLVAVFVVQAAVDAALALWLTRPLANPASNAPYPARALLGEAAPIIIFCAVSAAHLNIDIALVAWLADETEAGLLGAATRVAYLGLAVPAAVTASMMPVLASADRDAATRIARRWIGLLTLLGVAAAATLAVTAPIAAALFGPGFEAVTDLVPVLALRVGAAFPLSIASAFLLARRRQLDVMWLTLAVAGLSVCAAAIAIPRAGALGAAWVAVAAQAPTGVLLALAWRRAE